jgi:hypothetical protein
MAQIRTEWRELVQTKLDTMKQLVQELEMANISRMVVLHEAGIVEQ